VRIPANSQDDIDNDNKTHTEEEDSDSEAEKEIVSKSETEASDAHVALNKTWKIPKAHGLIHTPGTINLYGPLPGSSAEVVEKRHCSIKKMAEGTNQRADFKLQILVAEHRKDETKFTLLDSIPDRHVDPIQSKAPTIPTGLCFHNPVASRMMLLARSRLPFDVVSRSI